MCSLLLRGLGCTVNMPLSERRRSVPRDPKKNKRARSRAQVGVRGKIFFPSRQYEEECLVCDLSPDGAGLKTSCSGAVGSPVILYVDGLGRFEGTIARHDRLRVGIKFKCSDVKRARIAELIASYVELGVVNSTSLRERTRRNGDLAVHYFSLLSGETMRCEVVDIALSGASFRTDKRPPVGEIISFGRTSAMVVRHTEFGIAVTFMDSDVLDTSRAPIG
jgi:hypothetical protein